MRAVELLVESMLPEDVRKPGRTYTAKDLNEILADIGRKYPDKFVDLQSKIADVGRHASYHTGETMGLSDFEPVYDRDGMLSAMDKEIAAAKRESKNPDEFKNRKAEILTRYSDIAEKATMEGGTQRRNSIALAVSSGARGKKAQVKAMISTPGVYSDSSGALVPIFIRHSFAEGLRPGEFAASTYGARLATVSTKTATALGGDFGKQLNSLTSNLLVTHKDCGTDNGIDMAADDPELKYRVLSKPVAGFKEGSMIDGRVLTAIRKSGEKAVMVRSPLTCQNKEGLCAKCAGGHFTDGKLPRIGDLVGMTASQSLGEPVAQGSLSAKHTSGITGTKRIYSGFNVISQIVQSPDSFPDRAAVAEKAGRVESIAEAPQGGQIVTVDGEEHYVPQGYPVTVKIGDNVEAGDQLSDGIVDARDILRTRGLGEARLHYANRLKQAMDDSGHLTNRVATEVIARNALDHLTVDDPEGVGDYLPDDVISYNMLQGSYHLPADAQKLPAHEAAGKYLQQNALHYTIGTQLTPKMTKHLAANGHGHLLVSDQQPGFHAEMSRLRTASHAKEDWMQRLQSSYLTKQLEDASTRGDDTNVESNINWAPRLAAGEGFGKHVRESGKF